MREFGQQPGAFMHGMVDRVGKRARQGVERALFVGGEARNGQKRVDEVAIAELGGNAAGGRVRMFQVPFLFQGRHRVADGGRTHRKPIALSQRFRRHRHSRLHEAMHDLVQHIVFS
jgi:hypothetical protein